MNYFNTCSLMLKLATLRLNVMPLGLVDELFMLMLQKILQEKAGGIDFAIPSAKEQRKNEQEAKKLQREDEKRKKLKVKKGCGMKDKSEDRKAKH